MVRQLLTSAVLCSGIIGVWISAILTPLFTPVGALVISVGAALVSRYVTTRRLAIREVFGIGYRAGWRDARMKPPTLEEGGRAIG